MVLKFLSSDFELERSYFPVKTSGLPLFQQAECL